ncbi:MAG TPA: nuclear transport factor 2 family protein [Mycobacterium sp.]|nr:nuclear transport factor 2 family protein [Mycobacterium sp.]
MDARALVEKFVDAFGDGRLQDALGLLHDEFVVHAAGDVPYSGDYRGAEGFSELIAKMMAVLELTPSPDMQYIADGDKVVLYYRLTFTSRTSGNSVEMDVSEVFTVGDGLIAGLDVYYKNPSAVSALLEVAS